MQHSQHFKPCSSHNSALMRSREGQRRQGREGLGTWQSRAFSPVSVSHHSGDHTAPHRPRRAFRAVESNQNSWAASWAHANGADWFAHEDYTTHGKCTGTTVGHAHGATHHARKVPRLLQQHPHTLSQSSPPPPPQDMKTCWGTAQGHLVLSLGVRLGFINCKVIQGLGVTVTLLNVSASSRLVLPQLQPQIQARSAFNQAVKSVG